MQYIFGPVNSRRFGKSLGIDLSPSIKQCNFDCLYCELLPKETINKQTDVANYLDIFKEVSEKIKNYTDLDYITFTANGEPTLYPYIDKLLILIDKIKNDNKTLILTNSTGICNEHIYKTLLKFDAVKLSLDSVSNKIFKKIDRPNRSINLEEIKKNIIKFSHDYNGKLYIEILVVQDINDTKEEFIKLNKYLSKVKFEKIHLNNVDRPPSHNVSAVSNEKLLQLSHYLTTNRVEFNFKTTAHNKESYTNKDIINTLAKRPLTKDDIQVLFDRSSKDRLKQLENSGIIVFTDNFYKLLSINNISN